MKIKSIIVIMFAFLLGLYSCKKEEDFKVEIYNEPGYAIGEISSYLSIPFKVTYYFDFTVNNINYVGNEVATGIGQENSRLIGRSYLVVYKLSDPNKSDLNFNYYIEDEQEFQELLKEFETNPPTP